MLAIYYSILQGERYLRNEDASINSFRKFNQRPEDNYPDLTICIKGGHFNDLIKEYGLPRVDFSNILKGNFSRNGKPHPFEKNIYDLNPESYFRNLDHIIQSYTFITNKNVTTYKKNKDVSSKESKRNLNNNFIISYQDPDKKCITRHSKMEEETNIIRKKDILILNAGTLDDKDMKITTQIFFHLPGQFGQHMERPLAEHTIASTDPLSWKGQRIKLTIPSMTKLRKRSTSSEPCMDRIENDITSARNMIVEMEKCIPRYWKSLMKETHTTKFCNTSDETINHYYQLL